ncbi:MAG TPA: PQQ-binding-like beta-propeller repeat protein [Chitinophagaceae bacterium]|nr:PQQ-binding-like beta-propeller repeat protein [Chitinophagaceae bacterium]
MKKLVALLLFCCSALLLRAQVKPFHFAFISDTHIGSPDGNAEKDLRHTVADINGMDNLDFAVITGDITELGTDTQLKLAKQLLDSLRIPWYIIPGNHDAGWSESGGVSFARTFGNDRFTFDHNGIRFIACASGPYVRMSDGHIPRDAIRWLDSLLKKTPASLPVVFLNHYPIDNSLDNWYEAIDRLKQNNTIAILCGHGHTNKAFSFEDIPGVMGRSNLRAKAAVGGYNLVEVRTDSILFSERRPGVQTLPVWAKIKIERHSYSAGKFTRPDYSINKTYPQATAKWVFASDANVISTPALAGGLVVFGNQQGRVDALSLSDGKKQWSFQTGGSIFSSPAVAGNKLVLGSGDGVIYCLQAATGRLLWKLATAAAVLGSPLIDNNTVYIGGSDHRFRAIDLATGKERWSFDGLDGPVVSTPLLYNNKIIFGAWDTNLYALDKEDGKKIWSWNNGSTVRNFSPAACIPVAYNGVVYVVAPDRYITALDAGSGTLLWRSNESTVRESIGLSADGKWVYGKTMNDTIVAFPTGREKPPAAWKMNAGFGYEHVPSMLVEKDGQVFFGTRLGVVYAIDPRSQKIAWAHKIDNSMVNTVRVLSRRQVIASTMDGKVALLEVAP